jgi:hypothetical protein
LFAAKSDSVLVSISGVNTLNGKLTPVDAGIVVLVLKSSSKRVNSLSDSQDEKNKTVNVKNIVNDFMRVCFIN